MARSVVAVQELNCLDLAMGAWRSPHPRLHNSPAQLLKQAHIVDRSFLKATNAKVSDGWPHRNSRIGKTVMGQPFAPPKN
jgi:hypothetical protein